VQELLPEGTLFAVNKTFPIVPTSNAVRSLTSVPAELVAAGQSLRAVCRSGLSDTHNNNRLKV
jgi:hypothetical protein